MNQDLQGLQKLKTIAVSEQNYEKLRRLGYTADSFNTVISRLLEQVKKNRE